MRRREAPGVLVIAMAMLSGCTSQTSAPSTVAAPSDMSALPSQTSGPLASPSLEGMFVVDDDGRSLAMECWGSGDPTVFIESGGGAIDEFGGSTLVDALAPHRRVCLYNRTGRHPATLHPRNLGKPKMLRPISRH